MQPKFILNLNFRGSKLGAETQLFDGLELSVALNAGPRNAAMPRSESKEFDSYTLRYNGRQILTLIYAGTGEILFRVERNNALLFIKNNPTLSGTYLKYAIPFLRNSWYQISYPKLLQSIKQIFAYLPFPTPAIASNGLTRHEALPDPVYLLVDVLSQVALFGIAHHSAEADERNGLLVINSSVGSQSILATTAHLLSGIGLLDPLSRYIDNLALNFPPTQVNSAVSLRMNTPPGGGKKTPRPEILTENIQDSMTSGLLKLEINATTERGTAVVHFPVHVKTLNPKITGSLRPLLFELLRHYF